MRMSLESITSSKRVDQPLRVLVYGNAGIGKSTLGAQTPSAVFLCAENGVSHLDVKAFPQPETWADALAAIDTLTVNEHPFKTLVIDTLDWLEPLVFAHVCKKAGKPDIEAFGYGKGYVAALDEWRVFVARLELLQRKRGMHVVLLGHAVARDHKDHEADSWKQWMPKMNDKAFGLLVEWCDAVLYATHETYAKKDGPKVRGMSTGARLLHTEWTAGHVAKNRHGLPPTIPLAWHEFFGRVRGVAALRADLDALLPQLPEEKRARATDLITEAGDDPAKLSSLLARTQKTLSTSTTTN